jgi:hypothetical protein
MGLRFLGSRAIAVPSPNSLDFVRLKRDECPGEEEGQQFAVEKGSNMSKAEKTRNSGTTRRERQKPAPAKGAQAAKPSAARRGLRAAAHKPGSKAAQILALLKQPAGATLKAVMKATGWQAHSVRGFVSGYLVKRMGVRVKSYRRDGERVYAIKA